MYARTGRIFLLSFYLFLSAKHIRLFVCVTFNHDKLQNITSEVNMTCVAAASYLRNRVSKTYKCFSFDCFLLLNVIS